MKKSALTLMLALFVLSSTWAQRTLTGTVTDEDGIALIGATILAKGTTSGTLTDDTGVYSLTVPSDVKILIFSYTGFTTQEIEVGTSNVMDVTLSQGLQLNEVVVTALGIEKESGSLGYSIDQLNAEEFTRARETNIVNSLQGKVTGVNVSNTSGNLGGSAKITIRGLTSLSGRNDPLWVVDGMPINNGQFVSSNSGSRITGNRDFGNGAQVVNPDDIETMSILKGAAATALYGSRAAAGAIIITTKKGESNDRGTAKVTVNSSIRWDNLFLVPDYQQDYAQGASAKYDSSSVG